MFNKKSMFKSGSTEWFTQIKIKISRKIILDLVAYSRFLLGIKFSRAFFRPVLHGERRGKFKAM